MIKWKQLFWWYLLLVGPLQCRVWYTNVILKKLKAYIDVNITNIITII